MVFVNVHRTGMTAAAIAARLRQAGVGCSQPGPYRLRFVTHLDVHTEDIGRAVATARAVLAEVQGVLRRHVPTRVAHRHR